jgi:hypothetical protein
LLSIDAAAGMPLTLQLAADGVGPAIGRFVEANPIELEIVAILVSVGGLQQAKGRQRQVFCGGRRFEENCTVFGKAREKLDDGMVVTPREERVVPRIDQLALRDQFT